MLHLQSAVAEDEFESARLSLRVAEAQLATAQAEYDVLKSGTWRPDLELALAEVALARAELGQVQCDIDRLTIRAPIDGQILQMNARIGEYVSTPSVVPLLLLGQTDQLRVRAEFDDQDIDRLRFEARAIAVVRGRSRRPVTLTIAYIEPSVIPKSDLTGGFSFRVDTRVLQVVYRVPEVDESLFVGQELDVFIEAVW